MSRILAFSKANPLIFGAAFSTVKTSGADLLVQFQFEGKTLEQVDWRRNLSFSLFGCFYLGGMQYALYVPVFSRLFPNAEKFAAMSIKEKLANPKGIRDMLAQVFLDQCVHHPLMYFPVFYSLKEVVGGGSVEGGLAKYRENWWEDLQALWKVWVPATMFNFTFSPMYMRIPVVATTSMLWTCILSAMRGGDGAPNMPAEEAMKAIGGGKVKLEAAALDPGLDHVIVTAHGKDRVGLLSLVSDAVANKVGGSVSETKMVKMGGQFMLMMVVSVRPEAKHLLEPHLTSRDSDVGQLLDVSLTDISESNRLSAREALLKRRATALASQAIHTTFEVSGPDRPGILAEVTAGLARHGLNVERLETSTTKGAGPGEPPTFRVVGEGELFPGADLEAIQAMAKRAAEKGLKYDIGFKK